MMVEETYINGDELRTDTIHMLNELNEYQLQAIQSLIKDIISRTDEFYKSQSEDELFDRIDSSIVQIDSGLAKDSELVEKDIIEEFGL